MNATGHVPSEVVRAVAQEFSVDVTPQAIMRYNPTRVQGEKLSATLKELFYATRKAARAQAMEDMPLGDMYDRMTLLMGIVERNAGIADKITAAAIEAARREVRALDLGDGDGLAGVFRVINSPDFDPSLPPSLPPASAPDLAD